MIPLHNHLDGVVEENYRDIDVFIVVSHPNL